MIVRDATAADAAAIAEIYNQGIEDRAATLETEFRSEAERVEWLAARSERHPVIVAVDDDGNVAGWGSLNPFNPRPVYRYVADFSVYVNRNNRGQGTGSALLAELETRAIALDFHKLVLSAFPHNARGLGLYQRHGFRIVGVYHEQGMLDDRWVDVIVMEKLIAPAE